MCMAEAHSTAAVLGGLAFAESKLLLRCYHLVERAVSDRDHLIWVLGQSLNKRKARILNQRDVVDDALVSEKRMLATHKKLLQRQYVQIKALVKDMKQARDALTSHMRIKRIPLGLNADAHSGAVEGPAFPLPLEWDPKCVSDLAQVFTRSQDIRKEVNMVRSFPSLRAPCFRLIPRCPFPGRRLLVHS